MGGRFRLESPSQLVGFHTELAFGWIPILGMV